MFCGGGEEGELGKAECARERHNGKDALDLKALLEDGRQLHVVLALVVPAHAGVRRDEDAARLLGHLGAREALQDREDARGGGVRARRCRRSAGS